ncbi:hypothetical protein [Pelagibius sp.]|uniref:hypothetical protein n=1 Tax=Pelagibius sp. TaxID=1931238 RepID=UPI003BAF4C55
MLMALGIRSRWIWLRQLLQWWRPRRKSPAVLHVRELGNHLQRDIGLEDWRDRC